MSIAGRILLFTTVFIVSSVAGPITSVVVYGDSLSDNGNVYAATGQPAAPYYNGRFSNGPVAVEYLAQDLGVPLHDFAWGGATTGIGNVGDSGNVTTPGAYGLPGMLTEFSGTSALVPGFADALFVVWGGANDFSAPSPLDTTPQQRIARSVGNLMTIVLGLQSLGAMNILVPGMPDLGLAPDISAMGAPAAAAASAYSDAFNAALMAGLPPGVKYFDTASPLRAIVANPSAYGFTNAASPCFNGTAVCSNPEQYVFWDGMHPTSTANAMLGAQLANTVPEPASFVVVAAALFGLRLARRLRG